MVRKSQHGHGQHEAPVLAEHAAKLRLAVAVKPTIIVGRPTASVARLAPYDGVAKLNQPVAVSLN